MKAAKAETAVEKLTVEIFPRFGICESIHQDRGSHFTADLAYEVAQLLGIKQTFTPAYK